MTQKAGQKCTATRRVFVPSERLDEARAALVERLSQVRVGDPLDEEVGMGPVVSAGQRRDVEEGVSTLVASDRSAAEVAVAAKRRASTASWRRACWSRTIARAAVEVHRREVFGPVATLMPYDGSAEEAGDLVATGRGLAGVERLLRRRRIRRRRGAGDGAVERARPRRHRRRGGEQSLGPAPCYRGWCTAGRAAPAGGEELGGIRGLHHFMQRTAVQGPKSALEQIAAEAIAPPA